MNIQNDQSDETVETAPEGLDKPPAREPEPPGFSPFRTSLSKLQTVVGLTAGMVSIAGALLSFTGYFRPAAAATGKLVAIVRDRNDAAVGDALVEVLTAERAVVTTLAANALGQATLPIEPGAYILNVRHPRLGSAMRVVEVRSGTTAEVRVSLRGAGTNGSTAPVPVTGAATAMTPATAARPAPPAPAPMPAASPPTEPRRAAEPPTPSRGGAQAP